MGTTRIVPMGTTRIVPIETLTWLPHGSHVLKWLPCGSDVRIRVRCVVVLRARGFNFTSEVVMQQKEEK